MKAMSSVRMHLIKMMIQFKGCGYSNKLIRMQLTTILLTTCPNYIMFIASIVFTFVFIIEKIVNA